MLRSLFEQSTGEAAREWLREVVDDIRCGARDFLSTRAERAHADKKTIALFEEVRRIERARLLAIVDRWITRDEADRREQRASVCHDPGDRACRSEHLAELCTRLCLLRALRRELAAEAP